MFIKSYDEYRLSNIGHPIYGKIKRVKKWDQIVVAHHHAAEIGIS
jgi:hypothetical protein